jgi:hypothetical protein
MVTLLAILGTSGLASPAHAGDPAQLLCLQLVRLVEAGRDGAIHRVRIEFPSAQDEDEAPPPPRCKASDDAGRAFCRWLPRHLRRTDRGMLALSQDALECLGKPREPPLGDDGVVLHSWWSGGTWSPESGALKREHVDFAMTMDLGADANPFWIELTVKPR